MGAIPQLMKRFWAHSTTMKIKLKIETQMPFNTFLMPLQKFSFQIQLNNILTMVLAPRNVPQLVGYY